MKKTTRGVFRSKQEFLSGWYGIYHGRTLYLLLKLISILCISSYGSLGVNCLFAAETKPYEVMPWRVGQYVVYQIISMDGEDADNRYRISLVGKEEINGIMYFWVKIDIYESVIYYGYNTITKEFKKNISLKALVPPKDTTTFISNPSFFISTGIFPKDAIKLTVQIGEGEWDEVDPKDFFSHQDIIEDTPYSLTPHAKGKIKFSKLKIEKEPQIINSPAGYFLCYRFFVNTTVEEKYWDEGLSLWRSPQVPILGIVKMHFSRTFYWQKWSYRNRETEKNSGLSYLKSLYKKRVSGRRRPDTCYVLLLDYDSR